MTTSQQEERDSYFNYLQGLWDRQLQLLYQLGRQQQRERLASKKGRKISRTRKFVSPSFTDIQYLPLQREMDISGNIQGLEFYLSPNLLK